MAIQKPRVRVAVSRDGAMRVMMKHQQRESYLMLLGHSKGDWDAAVHWSRKPLRHETPVGLGFLKYIR